MVVNHFHNDCLGGLDTFHQNDIKSYDYEKTMELGRKNDCSAFRLTAHYNEQRDNGEHPT